MAIDFIQGQKFRDMADFTYAPVVKLPGDYDNLPSTFRPLGLKKDVNVVYTHTMYASSLFKLIAELPTYQFVVITHNSDDRVVEGGVAFMHNGNGIVSGIDYFALPDNVIRWYSKNVRVNNPRIESIPIGIENDMWFPSLHKKEKIQEKPKQLRLYKNLVYLNHNINTNPPERLKPYQILEGKPWATVDRGNNGSEFDRYLENLYTHKFVICPEGNGMDTHRTWECLYLGTIPIEKRNINNQFYSDLPILLVDDWEEVTEEFLEAAFPMFQKQTWNRNKLTFEYWKNKILS